MYAHKKLVWYLTFNLDMYLDMICYVLSYQKRVSKNKRLCRLAIMTGLDRLIIKLTAVDDSVSCCAESWSRVVNNLYSDYLGTAE